MGLLGGLAGRLAGVPKIIFTAHGWAFNEPRPRLSRKFFKFLQWLTILLSDTTVAVSEKTKKDIVGLPFVKNKIIVIHNGVAPIDFLEKEMAREKLSPYSNGKISEIVVGTVSELHKNKGLDFLISACADLPENISVYIVGDGEEKENLQNQIKKLGLSGKIFLTGRIENAKTLLKAFDIFTLTSRTEALPYSILEAGLAGLAVVASNVGGIPEIIENEKNGILTEAGNIAEISKSLKNLLLEPQKCDLLGANLREKVLKDFSLQKMISETEKFYTPTISL
jgi:glycosyltransferase involved in cell wall biosynthesis